MSKGTFDAAMDLLGTLRSDQEKQVQVNERASSAGLGEPTQTLRHNNHSHLVIYAYDLGFVTRCETCGGEAMGGPWEPQEGVLDCRKTVSEFAVQHSHQKGRER